MDNKLIAETKRRGVPPLDSLKDNADPTVYLEIRVSGFLPRWFVTEAKIEAGGRDILFFGYFIVFEKEWGYFRLSLLEATGSPLLVDYSFKPLPFSELKKAYNL